MNNISIKDSILKYKWVFLAVWAAVIYWLTETILDVYVGGGNIVQNLIYISSHELWMRSVIIVLILFIGIYTQSRFLKMRKVEKRIKRLNSLLFSIRNINQLIVQETDLKKILDGSVKILLKTRGYLDIYIAMKRGDSFETVSHAGAHKRVSWKTKSEEADPPKCIEGVLKSKKMKIIKSTKKYCRKCQYCVHERDHKSVLVPMFNDDSIIGILTACLREDRLLDEKEIFLLQEVANDLAYAIDKMRVQEEKDTFERKKEFLNTVLRQDLRSKSQLATGYLQLIEENSELSPKDKNYLESALSNTKSIINLIEEVDQLREIEEKNKTERIDLIHIIDGIIEDFSDKSDLKIIRNIEPDDLIIKGDHSLKYLLKNIIKIRGKENPGIANIQISLRENTDNVVVSIDDDGEMISRFLKKGLLDYTYTGEMAGKEGSRYYIIKELIQHNKGKIKIKDSDMGGARFEIHLNKT